MIKLIDKKLIKRKFYVTHYFLKTKQLLKANNVHHISLMQFKTNAEKEYMMAGVNEILEIIKNTLPKRFLGNLIIKYAPDGTIIKPGQCAFSIEGDYTLFCELENIIDSILARRCSVATNCWRILQIISTEQLIFMSDRSDDYRLQPYDGYAAYVAGVRNFSNQSHVAFINDPNVHIFGSMPHAFIHQFHGDITEVFKNYQNNEDNDGVILVDFENDILKTLKELKPFFSEIKGVRLDTSINMIDKSLQKEKEKCYGVNSKLVKLTRQFLDNNGGSHIKIIVSSNNNLKTVTQFAKDAAPIDFYGIGTYLTHLSLHFTADLVELDKQPFAKTGRKKLDDSHLIIFH